LANTTGAPKPLIIVSTASNYVNPSSAILRETSGGTSYSKIRLVFRPFTQLYKVICTSTYGSDLQQTFASLHPFQAKIIFFRVSTVLFVLKPGWPKALVGRCCVSCESSTSAAYTAFAFTAPVAVTWPLTHRTVELLGSCFQTSLGSVWREQASWNPVDG